MIVVDASVVVAALADGGPVGQWAGDLLGSETIAGPHLLKVEAANIFRRAEQHGHLSVDATAMAHGDLVDLALESLPYEPFATRVWELRDNVTAYDAWYVAIAEEFGTGLATLDVRLAGAPGPTCEFILPPTAD